MIQDDDLCFAKIVTDPFGTDHILIAGRIVTLNAPRDENNALVDAIVRGLRNSVPGGLREEAQQSAQ